jgi:hypothetical protein
VLRALVLGDESGIDEPRRQAFTRAADCALHSYGRTAAGGRDGRTGDSFQRIKLEHIPA